MGACISTSYQDNIFKVSYDNNKGTLEVTSKFLLYIGETSMMWSLSSLCKYGYDGCCLSIEVSNKGGLYKFYTEKADAVFNLIAKYSNNTKTCPSLPWEGPETYPIVAPTTTKRSSSATSTFTDVKINNTQLTIQPPPGRGRGVPVVTGNGEFLASSQPKLITARALELLFGHLQRRRNLSKVLAPYCYHYSLLLPLLPIVILLESSSQLEESSSGCEGTGRTIDATSLPLRKKGVRHARKAATEPKEEPKDAETGDL